MRASTANRCAATEVAGNDDDDHRQRRRPTYLYGADATEHGREREEDRETRTLTLDAFGCSEEVGEAGDGGNRR